MTRHIKSTITAVRHALRRSLAAPLAAALCLLAGACSPEAESWVGQAAPQQVMGRVAQLAARQRAMRRADSVQKTDYTVTGTLTDTEGHPVPGVTVSDGYTCTQSGADGRFSFRRDSLARFIFYTVPSWCRVPTHSETDRTACFYLPVAKGRKEYNFTLTRLPAGKEEAYTLIVIGDPQVTNAINPFYTSADDNPVKRTDLERFTQETMADIRSTIARLPKGMPVYGLSMGDDVQYYGGYNAALERGIRTDLGDSEMRLFSVIGNHDQDGNALYRRKWEDSWGPTDYSFDRGDEHYVCLNNVQFTRKAAYYSPGELTERQMRWLRQDLALTPHDKRVVLCYHIPFTFGCSPARKAQPLPLAAEEGHYSSSRLGQLLRLLEPFSGYELFCGHTHFAVNHEIDFAGQHITEHCHAAACGNIWQSNINLCGTPNGYYVYTFNGLQTADCHYKGTFWDESRQMTLFRADTRFNGESYADDWNLPRGRAVLIANVFNADSRWTVTAVENGREYPMHRISSRGQDAFAAGYHHKYIQAMPFRFVNKQNGYLLMNHLFYYEPADRKANVIVRARDPYGHVFEADTLHVVKEPFFNFAHYYDNGQ